MKTPNEWAKLCHQLLTTFILNVNAAFHQLPAKSKRSLLLVIGVLMAFSCISILVQSLNSNRNPLLPPETMTRPQDIFPNEKIKQQRSVIGKLYVIINPDTLLFDVATNIGGQIFLKADSSHQPTNRREAQPWQLISLQEWRELIRQFRFLPDTTHQ